MNYKQGYLLRPLRFKRKQNTFRLKRRELVSVSFFFSFLNNRKLFFAPVFFNPVVFYIFERPRLFICLDLGSSPDTLSAGTGSGGGGGGG